MTTLKFINSLSLLITFVLYQISWGKHYYVYHSCSITVNHTTNDHFELNVDKLLNYLSSSTPRKGYSFGVFGKGQLITYGHALCRGDVSDRVCSYCVNNTIDDIRTRCPHSKRAIIWYEKCFLKYSDTNFYGHIDRENQFVITRKQRRLGHYELWDRKRSILVRSLVDRAPKNSERYEMGHLQVDESNELFGLAQCIPVLSYYNCITCLDESVKQLPNVEEKIGAHIISGSCLLRIEIYPFLHKFRKELKDQAKA